MIVQRMKNKQAAKRLKRFAWLGGRKQPLPGMDWCRFQELAVFAWSGVFWQGNPLLAPVSSWVESRYCMLPSERASALLLAWDQGVPTAQLWAGQSRTEWELGILVSRLPLWMWPLVSSLYRRNLYFIKELPLAEVMTLEQESLDPIRLRERSIKSLLRLFHDELWVAMRLTATPLNLLAPHLRNPLLHRQMTRINTVFRILEEVLDERISEVMRQFLRGRMP